MVKRKDDETVYIFFFPVSCWFQHLVISYLWSHREVCIEAFCWQQQRPGSHSTAAPAGHGCMDGYVRSVGSLRRP